MASPVRRGGPFAPPRTSVARLSEGNLELNEDKPGVTRQPSGNPPTRLYGSSHNASSGGGAGLPLAPSPLSRPPPQPLGSPRTAASPFAQVPQQPSYPAPTRIQPPRQMLSQQLPSPSSRTSRSKIVPENSGPLEYAGSGGLHRLQLPPGSPLVDTPTGSRPGSRNWDSLPGVEQLQPQQQPQHQVSAPLVFMSPQPAMVSPFLGGGLQLVAESQSGIGSSPLPTLPPAPTTPAGIVVIKNNVTLVVHHYVKEPDSDDTDVEEERGSNTSSNCSSDSETQQQGSGLPPAPPQPSAFLRCMAVICCMASAVPPQRRSRRRRRHSSRLMSATEAELAGHVIGPQAGQVDFRSKYQKAQAVTPIPVLKRTNSAGALTSLARTPLASTPQAVSRVGTGGGMMVGEPPGTGYSAGSRFSSYSVPPEVSSPLPRCNSLRSPADVRLSEVLGGGLPSAAAAGGGGTTPVIADAVGWSFVGALGVGGASGGGIAGGSPTGGGGLRVAGDSGGLSTISSFSGHLSSGRPSATQAPVLIAGSLVQCFQQLGQRAAGAGLEGGVGLAAAAQARELPRRTATSSTNEAGNSSCRTTSYKRQVRWH